MRIPSGVTDQYIYFVAVDSTDFSTRETGLSSFTVYRSRNGAAAAAMTTPTINETDSSNMPGVYELLLDEDMTIGSGNDSEEMVFHITATGMAPVTRTIELYRPKITAGNTLGVASDGDISGNVDGNVAGSVASVTAGVTVTTNNDKTGYTASTVSDKTGYSISGTITTLDALDTAQDAQHAQTQSDIATVDTNVDAILVDTNELQTDWADGGRLDSILDARASQTSVDTVDSNVDAILVDTGTTIPAQISALNDVSVSDILTTQMTESYAADGTAPTLAQALFLIQQSLGDFSISGTTLTVRQLNGSTTAATFTLSDANLPTGSTRSG